MPEHELTKYPADRLREFCRRVFVDGGVSETDAEQSADVLITADLWGIDTHGVARLSSYYGMLSRGRVNPRPNIRVVREFAATATVDGDNGLGLIVGPRANEVSMAKAEEFGVGCVSVCNSSHFGIAGYYPYKALARDLIGWAMTNTTPQVAPLWGAEKMLGTNPLAIAFPGYKEPPVIIDFATSAVSYGKIENAIRMSESIPENWLLDHEGNPTTQPEALAAGGAILPLGGDRDHGGHKGYCLSAMIDLLCGVLSGANWGPFVPPFPYYLKSAEREVGKGIGHFFGAYRIDGFIEPIEFKQRVDEWIQVLRATRPAPGTAGPLIPGDPERNAMKVREQEGIPLLPSVVSDLSNLSKQTGIAI